MCRRIHVYIYTSVQLIYISPSSCAAVLRPCVLMALMVLHAALRSLKVNSLTSVGCSLKAAVIDQPREAVQSGSTQKEHNTFFYCFTWTDVNRDTYFCSSNCVHHLEKQVTLISV